MSVTEELWESVSRAAADPAWIMNLKDRLIETGLWEMMGCAPIRQKKNCAPPSAPRLDRVTAIRSGLWDNWPNGVRVKNHPNRYAMTIDLWDAPADEIEAVKVSRMNPAFTSNVSLMDRKALSAQIRHLRRPRSNPLSNVDPEYLDLLMGVSSDQPDALIGMINTNIRNDDSEYARGVYYHPSQFVLVTGLKNGATNASAMLALTDDSIRLAPFADRDCNGEALRGVIAQSRLDLIGFDETWGSMPH
jgi:hypothetical protein